ncbi:MAG: major capsid protein [Lentisphaeraceae bacterium]|nr:major capsid protein [Lentisphaeraceae bacterium]
MPNTTLPDLLSDEYLTVQANSLDMLTRKLMDKGLVDFKPITSTDIALVQVDGQLQILTAKQLGERGDKLKKKNAKISRFEAPYYPHESVLRAADVQNLKALPGSDQTPEQITEAVVMEKIDSMDQNYTMTFEWILMNMLKGRIMEDSGNILLNLYTILGKTKKTLDFKLGTETTDVAAKCQDLVEMVEDGLNGDTSDGVEVQVSKEFWKKLTTHKTVKEDFKNYNGNSNRNVEGHGSRFTYHGVTFERNNTVIAGVRFVDEDKGHAYPTGTMDTFKGTLSPADMVAYANTLGQRTYISTEDLPHGKGVEIHMESRPTAFCQRLDSLVEAFTSN